MGLIPPEGVLAAVDIDFEAAYGLVSAPLGNHRISFRYDTFEIKDLDVLKPIDNNDEDGNAWTVAYIVNTGERHRLAFEWLRIESERPARQTLGLPSKVTENLFQASFRVEF